MKKCRRCQKKSTKSKCKKCVKLRKVAALTLLDKWKKNNPKKVRVSKRRWDAKNKERVREYNRLWKRKNRKKYLKARRLWNKKNIKRIRAGKRRFYRNNPESVLRSHLKKCYGLSLEDFLQMRKNQKNLCAICKTEFQKAPHVDHCHKTGKIRGLLCGLCNISLGGFKDSPERLRAAANYLDKANPLK